MAVRDEAAVPASDPIRRPVPPPAAASMASLPDCRLMSIASLRIRPQVRTEIRPADVAALAASIESVGLLQPIVCTLEADGAPRVIEGHHRVMAFEQLGRAEIPAIFVEDELAEDGVLARQLVANIQRVGLNPVDKAEAIRRLRDEAGGIPAEAIAKLIGLSPASVSRALRLAELPDWLRDRVRTGAIPADAAYMLASVQDAETQQALAARVASKSLTRDGLVREIKRLWSAARASDRTQAPHLTSTPLANPTLPTNPTPAPTPRPKPVRLRFRTGGVECTLKAPVLDAAVLDHAIAEFARWVRQYVQEQTQGSMGSYPAILPNQEPNKEV